jgi:hypothetical protein
MKYLLVGVYQVCSNKSPVVKSGPAPGIIDFPSQECSFGGHPKNLIPCRTLVAMATDSKNLKYLLLKNPKS